MFALLAMAVTAPVWEAPGRLIIGAGLGDNAAAVWNFWWGQTAWHTVDRSVLWTDALFAPIGTSLVLNTSTLLPVLIASVLAPTANPILAYNVCIALTLWLNGVLTYLLCYRYTGRRGASLFGGLLFALAPFLVVRAQGHLNVLSAWVLPLVALCAERVWERPTRARGALLGSALGLTAYVDYYYFIFCIVLLFWMGTSLAAPIRLFRPPLTAPRRRLAYGLLGFAAVTVVGALFVWGSGGTNWRLGGREIRMTGTFNLRLIAWVLVVAAALTWYAPRPRVIGAPLSALRKRAGALVVAGSVLLLALVPLAIGAFHLWTEGDYVTQKYLWRSAPPGIDVAGLILGNPAGALWRHTALTAYTTFGMDAIEGAVWLGLLPAGLLILSLRRSVRSPVDARWFGVAALFGVWSLGPYLMLFGANTAWMLPQTALRFVPLLANARIPGRAFAVVLLAVAILTALEVSRRAAFRSRVVLALALVVLAADLWPARFATTAMETPRWVTALARMPPGIVMDVPMGLRDGFGELGSLDHRALIYQTVHGHAMTGGFVARLSPRVRAAYTSDAILGRVLQLSNPADATDAEAITPSASHACAVRYVSMARETSPELRAFVESAFTLRLLISDESRSLYIVDAARPPFCGTHVGPAASAVSNGRANGSASRGAAEDAQITSP